MIDKNKWALIAMSIGTFAIGTDAFIVAGILDDIVRDLNISIFKAGLIISIFSFSYMLFSPLSAWLLGNQSLKRLLILSSFIFLLGNLIIYALDGYYMLIVGRVVSAFGAAAFTPHAAVAATTFVKKENQGKAIAFVYGGMTVAIALGVPAGVFLVRLISWRELFLLILILSALSIIGLISTFHQQIAVQKKSLVDRLALLKNGRVLFILLITFLVVASEHIAYSYISIILSKVKFVHMQFEFRTFGLLIFGFGAVIGNYASGILTDKFGGKVILLISVILQTLSIFLIINLIQPLVILFLMFIWGVTGWMYLIPIQHKLIALSPSNSTLAVALNSSILYMAIGSGGVIGGLILQYSSLESLSIASLIIGLMGVLLSLRFNK